MVSKSLKNTSSRKNETRKNETETRKKTIKHRYTKKHYSSGDGMLTTVWGPPMWHFLHTVSFNYPVEPTCNQKKQYREFILSLQYVLPCGKCRINLCKNLKKLPLTIHHMLNRGTFSLYIYKLHEMVNTMLHKKSGLTYDQVRDRYEDFRARCVMSDSDKNTDTKKENTDTKKENGCTDPVYGEKSRCILKIVPQSVQCESLSIDKKCKRTSLLM